VSRSCSSLIPSLFVSSLFCSFSVWFSALSSLNYENKTRESRQLLNPTPYTLHPTPYTLNTRITSID